MSNKNKTVKPGKAIAPGRVPKLRFPEFRDMGAWEVKTLGEVAKRITRRNKDIAVTRVLTNSAIDGIIDQRDYFDKDIANKNNLAGYYIVEEGDYIYNPRISTSAPVGPIGNNKIGTGIMSPLYSIFQFKKNINDFYEHYFKTTCWHNYIRRVGSSGARHDRMSISTTDFMSMPVLEPGPEEQQKIADCLSSIDELITTQAQKLDVLKDHQKGLMQQLFLAQGETVPKLRFPEFRNVGVWEEKNGNLIFMQISNKKHNSDLPVLAITQEHGAIPRDMIDYHVSVTSKSIEAYKVVEEGDFIISLRSFQGGIEYSEYKGICSPAYIILRKKSNDIHAHFYKQFFKTERFIQLLKKNLEGLRDGKMVSYKQFSEILLPIPLPAEQKIIADCLSSLDKLITAQVQKLDTLKAHKKGLMQQLFPEQTK